MKPLSGALLFTFIGVTIWVAGYFGQPAKLVDVGSEMNASTVAISSGGEQLLPDDAKPIDLKSVKTFRGAKTDGALRVDKNGNLIVNLDLRHWIDFHLAASGEISLADIIGIMQIQIAKLPQPGRHQADVILKNYLGYLDALQEYDIGQQKRIAETSLDEMVARTQWQQRLRHEWFEPETAEAFFMADELMDNYTLTRLQLKKQGATEQELAALEENLPVAVQIMRKESRKLVDLEKQENQFKQQGMTTEEIDQWRRQQYGDAAAERLRDAEKRQDDWSLRLTGYQQYQQTLSHDGLSVGDRERLLQTYRDTHFSQLEQKRLSAALTLLAESQ